MAELISEIVGKEAYEQIKKLDEQLGELVKKFENNTRAALILEQALAQSRKSGSIGDLKKAAAELNKVQAEGIKIANDVVETSRKKEAAAKTYTDAINAQQKAELAEQLAASQGVIASKASATARGKQTTETSRLTKATKDELKAEEQLLAVQNAENASRQKAIAQIALYRAERDQLNLSTKYGRDRLVELNHMIDQNTLFLKTNGDAAQRQSMNVGNYPKIAGAAAAANDKFTFSLSKAWSGLRNLAYIIPGLGLAGIFDLAFQEITPLITKIYDLATGSQTAAKAAGVLKSAFEATEYKQAVTDVNELRINIELAKQGFLNKTDVVNEYNKTLGESLGKVTSLDEAEKMLVKNGDAYIQMTLLKAAANIALDKAAEQYVKAEMTRQTEMKKVKDASASYDGQQGGSRGFLQDIIDLNNNRGLGVDAVKTEVNGIKKEGDEFADIAKKFQTDAAKIASSLGMDFFGKEFDVKAKKAKKPKLKPVIYPNLSDTDLADLKKYYENLRKAQIDAMGQMINDPESKKVFDEFLQGDVLSGDKSVTDAKAQELADSLYKRIQDKANKKHVLLKIAIDMQMINDTVQMATEALSTINDIQYQREIAAIDAREKRMQDSYDADVKRVNASFTNQADKERELTRLEAIREAQKKKNDRDRISADRKRAQQQKAYDIASIITSTSLAVIKAYTEGDPYTKVARALLAGSAGAIALVRAASAPIPQYADGTDNHPGGKALVGEAGTELVKLPGGGSFLTSGPTIMDLPKRTEVISNEDLMKEIYAVAFRKMASAKSVTSDVIAGAFIESIEENTSEIKLLRKDVKDSRANVSIHGDFNHYMHVKNNIR